MASTELSKPANCLRWFFASCNIAFLVLGLLAMGIGLWGVSISVDGDYEVLTGGNLISGAVLLMVAGFITVVVAVCGFCGAAWKWRPLLVIYAVAVCVIVTIEIAAAILAFVFTDEANDEIRENMERAISNYRFNSTDPDYDEATNTVVETIQGFFECCGANNYTDWELLNPTVIIKNGFVPPARCFCDYDQVNCNTSVNVTIEYEDGEILIETTNVWDRGCHSILADYLESTSLINAVIAIVIAVIEIAFVLMAFCLCCNIHMRKQKDV